MAKILKTQRTADEMSRQNYGPAIDPFSYGFNTDPGFKQSIDDKYVTEGKLEGSKDELDLSIRGGETVKVNLDGLQEKYATKQDLSAISSSITEDTHVTAGFSDITESGQTLTVLVGTDEYPTELINISLSGIGATFATKKEMEEQTLKWGTF